MRAADRPRGADGQRGECSEPGTDAWLDREVGSGEEEGGRGGERVVVLKG